MHKTVDPTKQQLDHAIRDMRAKPAMRLQVFRSLPPELRGVALLGLTKHSLFEVLQKVTDEELVEALEYLDPDEATDVVQHVNSRRAAKIISLLSTHLLNDVQMLVEFDPHSAAGLMNLAYIQVDEDDTVMSVAKQLRSYEKRTGRVPAVLAMRGPKLVGYIPGHVLGLALPGDTVHQYVRKISTVNHASHKNEVVDLFRNHPHNKVAVLGDHGNVMGIIYSDDILRILQEQEGSTLYDFAGVHKEESVSDSTLAKVRSRYKWLIINLGTAFLAAMTVGLFEETITKYVLLAVYMPIVAGMGGNAATQTLAVLVRGIALKQIDLKTAWPTLKREMGAGLINGVINGVIVATIVMIFNNDLKIAIILGSAMVFNLLIAGLFGTIVPLIMEKLGKDPATSATIFITTATDVLGFLAFLGLATLLLA